ncbi:MAG: hypothetical protein KDI88_16885 [Gammaproteobacteria bacterium]|nr:hypothetical protein [Gammaproteobacteria bacterium]
MPSLKQVKAFAHNVADAYLGTLGWVADDYKSTWLYRAALDSGVRHIELDILRKRIEPPDLQHHAVLLASLDGVDEHFFSMLASQDLAPDTVRSLVFHCAFPSLAQETVSIVCTPVAIDSGGVEHRGVAVTKEYGFEILAK